MAVNLLSNKDSDNQVGSHSAISGMLTAETLSQGVFKVDSDWTVKYWNHAAEELSGVPAENIVGMNLWEQLPRSIPLTFYQTYHKVPLWDVPMHFEGYWEDKKTWFNVFTFYFDNTLSVYFKSVGQRPYSKHPHHPEGKLKTLTELYRFVTEVTNDCLWEWNLRSKVLFWIDGGHKRIFGYDIENTLIPQGFWESLVHPDDKVRLLGRLNKIIAARSVSGWEEEYRFKKADGEYIYVHERGHVFYDEGKRAIRMIGATQDISTRKSAEINLLDERMARQKEIIFEVLKAQDMERMYIGKELQDNMSQILGAAKLYLEMAKTDEQNRDTCLDQSSAYILKVINDINLISKALTTPTMHFVHLIENIKMLVTDLTRMYSIKINFTAKGIEEEELEESLQLGIFRIIQEQTANIWKSAKATHINITLARKQGMIHLHILDNGADYEMAKVKKGVGMIHIRSRAELLHGKASIAYKTGEGCLLKVILPLKLPKERL